MKQTNWMLALCLLGAGAAYADEVAVPEPAEISTGPAVSEVRAWLELQRSGQAASAQAQPLSGAAMDKVHERYIKSFGHAIPEHFEHAESVSK